jgi:hypothetical protein
VVALGGGRDVAGKYGKVPSLEVAKGARFCHPATLIARPARLNKFSSDSAQETHTHPIGFIIKSGGRAYPPLRLRCMFGDGGRGLTMDAPIM